MRPDSSASSVAGTRSTPITSSPRSANDRASGRPTRPRPMTATVGVTGGSLRGAPAALAQPLTREREHEAGVVVEVAGEQAARLLGDPVDPLEPALLHPAGGLRDAPSVEIERGAHPAHHRHLEPISEARHPLLLLRYADADPEHVRMRPVDLLDERALLGRGQLPERRREPAHDADARVLAAQAERELGERALVAPAVEPDAVAPLCAARAVAAHQLRAVDAVREPLAEQVGRPDNRHPVG